MSKSVLYMSMSLDGFITGPRRRPRPGLGAGGERLHDWLGDGGAEPPRLSPVGAQRPGLRRGDGDRRRARRPAHVRLSPAAGTATTTASRSSSRPGASRRSRSRTWVHYVTDGVESAMRQAKEAAGDANVLVHGADLAQSLLRAGVLDEIEIHLIPVLLGEGRRLFDTSARAHRARAHPRGRRARRHPPALPGGVMSARAQLILHMSVSLDGFVARSDQLIDWLTPADDGVDHGDQPPPRQPRDARPDRPDRDGPPRLRGDERGLVQAPTARWRRLMNALPQGRLLPEPVRGRPGSTRASPTRALAEEIPELKREAGKDIVVFGGGHIAHSLIRERLVDEFRLTVHPVALGEGISLDARPARAAAVRAGQQHRLRRRLASSGPAPGLSSANSLRQSVRHAAGAAAGHTW